MNISWSMKASSGEKMDVISQLELALQDAGRSFFRMPETRKALGEQAQFLQKEIQRKAPKGGKGYLSKNILASARYSNTAPYAAIIIAPRKAAIRYWIQREADPELKVGDQEYRKKLVAKPGGWIMVAPKGSPAWSGAQGYDNRSSVSQLAARAGHTQFVQINKDTGMVFSWKTRRQKKLNPNDGKIIFVAKKEISGGKAYEGGRYLGPSIKTRQEFILNAMMGAFTKSLRK
jgi:hypothetical protein